MSTRCCCLSLIVALTHLIGWNSKASCEATVEFNRDIRPILNKHCVACHGGVKQAGDLSFIYPDQALEVIEPGEPDDSTLIDRVQAEDDEERMPPPEHGDRLSPVEVDLLRRWIEEGAVWQDHWAFVVPHAATLPEVKDLEWCHRRMDYFVLAMLEQNGLSPSPPAPPGRWLRRVSLDLIGLPPTPEQRTAFLAAVANAGEAAYEREVQRLLDSAKFGERWASVWLDAVRYADSKGLGQDGRRSIWKYRDWVIDALNRDLPFDEFTVAQLAGDLLPSPSMDDFIASACHRATQTNEEGGTDDEQFRLEAVIDRVNTTWQVWQGLTFGCVQCHSHPYDPIRHEEYYEFLSFFNNTVDCDLPNDYPVISVPLYRNEYKRARELDEKIAELREVSWQSGFRLLNDDSLWQRSSGLRASTSNATKVVVENVNRVEEFHTVGTVSKDTAIVLESPVPADMRKITAIRITGLPHDPERAKADSEWGFVISHAKAELLAVKDESSNDAISPTPLAISRVIGDEPHPLIDPQLSLDERNPRGFGAYSRIHHARQVAFVLSEPLEVSTGSTLRVTLEHRLVETGAFPLVTRRGRVALSSSGEFTRWLSDPNVLEVRRNLAVATAQRSDIESVSIPIMRERFRPLARSTHVFERGNFLNKGALVRTSTPEFLPPLAESANPTRLNLAKWIAHPDNPLTGRVAVNRFWAQMFGVGLVETQEDFGSSGAKPSHPRLLDDLAVRFATQMGWSVKQLLREIALSSTYRQSSKVRNEVLELDPGNRLLARGPRTRLPAESVRDQALAISGLLTDKLYGPPVHPPLPADVWKPFQGGDKWLTPEKGNPDRYRRSIYTYTKRSIPFPMFASFDAPSREFCSARRLPSNTPLQALMTLNDQTFEEASQALAGRMSSAGNTPNEQIAYGVLLATGREPNDVELADLTRLYTKTLQGLVDRQSEADDAGGLETAALANVASVLLNLDEALCK